MDLRYPIGPYVPTPSPSPDQVAAWIDQIAALPASLSATVAPLSDLQLETPYRPGGWTLRQVVHHIADSHLNSLVRFKLALTEDHPTIKPYDEAAWALLPDTRGVPVAQTLTFIELLHFRLVVLLQSLTPDQRTRTYQHPESGLRRVDGTIGLYAWHGRHHLAHITSTIERAGW